MSRCRSKARCSRLLNHLRLKAGALLAYEEARDCIWPELPQPKNWRSQLATFVFWLREMGYPILTERGRGLRFLPSRQAIMLSEERTRS